MFLDQLDLKDINNGNDKKTNKNNLEFIFTSTNNQKNNKDKSNITMDFGQCEQNLKDNYGISENDSLYILQIIYEEEGMKIPKIEYEIYYPLNNTMTKLNLTSCEGEKIDIYISVEINDILDKYNPKSEYYNDICSKATSDSGTDINLKDRKNEYIDNNMSLCEENCKFVEYDYSIKKAKCSCDIKFQIPEINDIKFNKNDLYKSFIEIKNVMNLNVMKCYKTVLKINDLLKNYGYFIIFFILLFYFFCMFIFCCCSFNKLRNETKNIVFALKYNKSPKINSNIIFNKKNLFNKNSKINFKKGNIRIQKKLNNQKNKLKLKKDNIIKLKIRNQRIKRNYSRIVINNNKDKDKDKSNQKFGPINIVNKELIMKKNISNKNALKLKDFEINSLNYEKALLLDKRGYFEYYISLLKNNHPLFFSCFTLNDYNSFIIKMFLFFYSFSLDLTINALFFNDNTMHKIYEDKGKYNLLYQIPQILLSILISKIIDSIIRPLSLSQDNIVQLKNIKNKSGVEIKYKILIRKLKMKFTFFFILTFLVLTFFLYYITCFCGVYVNTQIHLIKDTLISFIIGLLYPFGMLLIPGIFRILSLKIKKSKRKYLYKFSSFIENFCC